MAYKKDNVLIDVIRSLANDAIVDTEGVRVSESKRANIINVTFLDSDRVSIDCVVDLDLGCTVPVIVATLQEKVKNRIEGATKFRVHSINVEVANVNIQG